MLGEIYAKYRNANCRKLNERTGAAYGLAVGAGVLLFLTAGTVVAAPITNTVTVGEKTWAQVTLFANLSWNDIDAACPEMDSGKCLDGTTLNGWDMTGWTWASIFDVGALFASTTPHPGGIASYSEINSTWAPEFFELGFEPTLSSSITVNIVGLTSTTLEGGSGSAYVGRLLWGIFGFDDAVETTASVGKTLTASARGGWFYQSPATEVPEPGTLPLFGLAFVMLAVRQRLQPVDRWRRDRHSGKPYSLCMPLLPQVHAGD
jgi:hypothetical protein